MSRRYTAQEMRETAKDIEADLVFSPPSDMDDVMHRTMAMLRQAADMIERAEGVIAANDESKNPDSVTRGPVQMTAMYILTGSNR